MKKILLSLALISSMTMASDYNYEVTPVIGYGVQEGNLGLDDAMLYGAEFQYNDVDCLLKPELSILASENDVENSTLESDILRIAINGVHEYSSIGAITPITKIGVGYETIDGTHNTPNSDGAFLDAGVGAKIALAKDIALKLEAVYMLKDGVKGSDNNLLTLAGLNFAFGQKAQPEPEPTPEPEVQPEPIDGDDDNDGVLNSVDKCPTTPAGQVVDSDGCMIKVNLHINFRNDSFKVDEPSDKNIEAFANFLKLQPNYTAKIVGHTDSRASEAYNQKLSEKRAAAVKDILVKKGVEAGRIATDGMGESEPVADNSTKEGRAQNRRIEASLIKN
jgi:OOP family OmpA-OmpF porin